MATIFDPQARNSLLQRIGSLTPDRPARWGRLTAPQMICHLTASLPTSAGVPWTVASPSTLSRFPFNWIVIHLLPWPKGKVESPPEFLSLDPTHWDADLTRLRAALEGVAARGPGGEWPSSPVFGKIGGRTWGALLAKHFDHHLRQFGV